MGNVGPPEGWHGMSLLPSVAFSLQAAEIGEARGQNGSGRKGHQRRGARMPRLSTTELGEHLMEPELAWGGPS